TTNDTPGLSGPGPTTTGTLQGGGEKCTTGCVTAVRARAGIRLHAETTITRLMET
ncbi:hypothetical protein LSAT2_011465, partial [Lamellibrachia satsuma]